MNTRDAAMPPRLSKLVCLGWYDGPTSGLALSEGDGRAFRFEMLDIDLDPDGADVRIFSLAPIPPSAFDRVVEAMTPYQAPRWPFFVPLWRFPTDEARERLDRLIDSTLAQAGPPAWVVATEDLASGYLAARAPDAEGLERLRRQASEGEPDAAFDPMIDWFPYLGLEKASARESES